MDKNDPPTSGGIFKPVGHTVIAFRSAAKAQRAVTTLLADGFSDEDLVRYTDKEMLAQVDAQLATASPLAAFGHEVSLARVHRELALSGCSFLVVHTPKPAQVEQVAALAASMKAAAAHRYGLWVVEDMIDEAEPPPEVSRPSSV